MKKTTIDLNTQHAIYAFIQKITTHYPVVGVILFGSRARHTHRPDSDADVAVLLDEKPRNFIETKFALDDIAFDLCIWFTDRKERINFCGIGETLNKTEDLRLIADYTGDLIDQKQATWVVKQASVFVDAIKNL